MARLASSLRWLFFALFLGLIVAHLDRAGALELRAPATVLSRAHPAIRAAEPLLLFLRAVRDRVPQGSSVAVIGDLPRRETYFLALSQLPHHRVRVVPEGDLRTFRGGLPDFVATHGRRLRHPDYRRIGRVPGGYLYRLAR